MQVAITAKKAQPDLAQWVFKPGVSAFALVDCLSCCCLSCFGLLERGTQKGSLFTRLQTLKCNSITYGSQANVGHGGLKRNRSTLNCVRQVTVAAARLLLDQGLALSISLNAAFAGLTNRVP